MTRDPVRISLAAVILVALASLGFLVHSPNRLVSGAAVALASLGLGPALLAIGPAVLMLANGMLGRVAGMVSPALTIAAAAAGARHLPGRIALGAGFWIALVAGLFVLVTTPLPRRVRIVVVVMYAAGFIAAGYVGAFDHLSLAREFAQQRAALAGATLRHLELSAATILFACLIGLPLGLLATRRPRLRSPLYGVLNILQTVPSIAAFGLLIAPLSALAAAVPLLGRLGIGGIGPAPALIALTLYGLLPVVRNTDAGLSGVDPAIRDAATGMGLTARRRLLTVELPLALPALLAGVRIMAVQTIGLATVAALIGAGGLGTFVFEGVGEYATDLVLLGALPVTAIALAVDLALRAVEERLG
jgi:osmoprotectant transport system permease protein